ncbi:MAG TPA: hypothetical protein VMT16_06460 [Thermoanaerobaculia bacterium]|nr:hypothetical protein [Thermoanaerobaculia bacterium]
MALAWLVTTTAAAWEAARIEPRVDNLEELLRGCAERHASALERHRAIDAWVAHQSALGEDVRGSYEKDPLPSCSQEAITPRLGSQSPGVWAIAASPGRDLLFATVNLPVAGVLVSRDGGASWHYRHLFLRGYNVDRGLLLRGIDYRHGVLAVASDTGLLLSRDGGRTFTSTLGDHALSAVALSPHHRRVIVVGGDGTSFLSTDGGETWSDLAFTAFTRGLATRNRFLIDHITSLEIDPADPATLYAGTGSHLYRFAMLGGGGRWQAMEGDGQGRVHDDSTVYNIEIGSRFMISTCNGVYYLARRGSRDGGDRADVSWGKFRHAAFSNRTVGGPKGNLRSYYVAEDPDEPGRLLVADFAGLYEGRPEGSGTHWRRVEQLPFYSSATGYPEYTAVAWTAAGDAVVGSRYRGIFVERRPPPRRPASTCALR